MTDTIEPLDAPLYPAIACLVTLMYKIPATAVYDWWKAPAVDFSPSAVSMQYETRSMECFLPFGHEGNHRATTAESRKIEYPQRGWN